ncbi:MAG: OFA family MFS transporter [Anaerovoracaceae bacterium]|nr:OFA family MFS transporter [Bacillota bacterium]MDY2670359.1 OFA family MFS transporter [Anaerovoracaceae bacterium]
MSDNSALTKSRWTTLWVSCIINLVIGTGYAWSVFGAAWATELNTDPGSTALAFTICNAVGPITMITGGKINDALGPKWVIFIGGLMFGGGMFITGFASNVTWIIIWYGLCLGLGMGLIYSCTIGNTVKFFPDKRGFVGGITTMAYGLGSVILAPIAAKMVQPSSLGIHKTFFVLGIIYLVVICVGAFLVKQCPAGFIPDGYVPPKPAANVKVPEDKTWSQMLKDPIFYVMFIMLVCGAFFGLMMISQCASIATFKGIAAAATIVSVLALFNALGRVGCGTISDKLGRINTLIICLILAAIGLVLMLVSGDKGSIALFVVGICLVGFGFGAFMGVYPGFTADQFGAKNNGVNYGIMFIAFALAGVLGPMIMKARFAATGSYNSAYIIAIVLAVVGLALAFVYKAMSKVKE